MKNLFVNSVRFLGFLIENFVAFLFTLLLFWTIALTAGFIFEFDLNLTIVTSSILIFSTFMWVSHYIQTSRREAEAEARAKLEIQRKREQEKERERERREKEQAARLSEEKEQRLINAKKRMLFPERNANRITKAKFESNGYVTNRDWDLSAKVDLIRRYGIQRFMFSPRPDEAVDLATSLEISAFEAELSNSIENLKPIYSISPVVEYWLTNFAMDHLNKIAALGRYLPASISFGGMASDIGIHNLSNSNFGTALAHLFKTGILTKSSNGFRFQPALEFVEKLLDTPEFQSHVDFFQKEGISLKVSLYKYEILDNELRSSLFDPRLAFEALENNDSTTEMTTEEKY